MYGLVPVFIDPCSTFSIRATKYISLFGSDTENIPWKHGRSLSNATCGFDRERRISTEVYCINLICRPLCMYMFMDETD